LHRLNIRSTLADGFFHLRISPFFRSFLTFQVVDPVLCIRLSSGKRFGCCPLRRGKANVMISVIIMILTSWSRICCPVESDLQDMDGNLAKYWGTAALGRLLTFPVMEDRKLPTLLVVVILIPPTMLDGIIWLREPIRA
jgi:hypothetical protein